MDFIGRLFRKVHGYFLPTRHNAYRPRLLHASWLLFFLALILTSEAVLLTNVFATQSARSYLAAVLPSDIVELTNLERGFNNVGVLAENAQLAAAAEAKAQDMAGQGYFAHVGPDGKEPWAWISGAGYSYAAAGENLAVRFRESEDVVEAWMASPTHRANIVKSSYTEIGVGVAQGSYKGAPATFVVQYFGRPTGWTAGQGQVSIAVAEQTANVLGAAAEREAKQDAATLIASVGAVPTVQAFAILAAAAILMLVVIFLTVVVNVQVQPVDLLLGGGGVAAVAVALLVLNFSYVGPALSPQAATVIVATEPGVVLDEGGASTPDIELDNGAGGGETATSTEQGDSELAPPAPQG